MSHRESFIESYIFGGSQHYMMGSPKHEDYPVLLLDRDLKNSIGTCLTAIRPDKKRQGGYEPLAALSVLPRSLGELGNRLSSGIEELSTEHLTEVFYDFYSAQEDKAIETIRQKFATEAKPRLVKNWLKARLVAHHYATNLAANASAFSPSKVAKLHNCGDPKKKTTSQEKEIEDETSFDFLSFLNPGNAALLTWMRHEMLEDYSGKKKPPLSPSTAKLMRRYTNQCGRVRKMSSTLLQDSQSWPDLHALINEGKWLNDIREEHLDPAAKLFQDMHFQILYPFEKTQMYALRALAQYAFDNNALICVGRQGEDLNTFICYRWITRPFFKRSDRSNKELQRLYDDGWIDEPLQKKDLWDGEFPPEVSAAAAQSDFFRLLAANPDMILPDLDSRRRRRWLNEKFNSLRAKVNARPEVSNKTPLESVDLEKYVGELVEAIMP